MTVRVIAEAGQCMEGSIDRAVEMVEDAARAGAWAFKTQLLRPDTIATSGAPKYWSDEIGTRTQREAFERAGLIPYSKWQPVVDACEREGIEFVATPFDLEAVEWLDHYGCNTVKIASGDLTYWPLLEAVADRFTTTILSTGACTLDEIRDALHVLVHNGARHVVLLACALVYPCPIDAANMGRIGTLNTWTTVLRIANPGMIPLEVGYSDHTVTVAPSALAAVAAGARYLEKHYTYSRTAGDVPDHAMAVDAVELRDYVTAAMLGARLRGSEDLEASPAERPAVDNARRSVWLARPISPGEILTVEHLAFLRPGTGTPPSWARLYLGTPALRGAHIGSPLGDAFQ